MATSEARGQSNAPPRSASSALAWTASIGIALVALGLHRWLDGVADGSTLVPSASVLALVAGIAVGSIARVRARLSNGAKAVSKAAIPWAIVLIGFGLDIGPLWASGSLLGGVGVTIALMVVAFGGAALGARLLGLGGRMSLLLGAGTAVCGNSAILAIAPAVEADERELGLAVGVINLLGVLMLFVLPPFAAGLGLDAREGGALAGLTVHAVPQAIATGGTFGDAGLELATLYKLLRVAMLVPVVLIVSVIARRGRGDGEARHGAGIPLFVFLFVAAATVRTLGLVGAKVALFGAPQPLFEHATDAGKVALGIALAAIGLGLDAGALVRVGPRVLLAGAIAVAAMVAAALPLLRFTS